MVFVKVSRFVFDHIDEEGIQITRGGIQQESVPYEEDLVTREGCQCRGGKEDGGLLQRPLRCDSAAQQGGDHVWGQGK